MFWNPIKFNKEIQALKNLPKENSLHPLRKEQIKQAILAEINAPLIQKQALRISWYEGHFQLFRYILASILGISLIGGTAFASGSSLPGDLLFPIKQIKEKIEISLTISAESRARLESQFTEERLKELTELRKSHGDPQAKNSDQKNNEDEAKTNLQNAIVNLSDVKIKLEAKGNTKAASSVGETLLRLSGKHEGGVEVEIKTPNNTTNGQNITEVKIKTTEPEEQDNAKPSEINNSGGSVKGEFNAKIPQKEQNSQSEDLQNSSPNLKTPTQPNQNGVNATEKFDLKLPVKK
jgi:Domain of unknown function (DUF5667)